MSKSKAKFGPMSIKLSGIHVMKNSDKGFPRVMGEAPRSFNRMSAPPLYIVFAWN